MPCLYLTPDELAALIAAGWTHEGGPFVTEFICEVNCSSSSSSSSDSSTSGALIPCCSESLPLTLTATISGLVNDCAAYNGIYTLTWDAGIQKWFVNDNVHILPFRIEFYCTGSHLGDSFAGLIIGPGGNTGQTNVAASCSPLLWTFGSPILGLSGTGLCADITPGGMMTVTP